jgi:DNA mismatch repair protein MutL
MACHGSVRAGDNLSHDEVRRLFADLDAVDFGANCPHGRPVWFRMTLAELETRFGRR